MDTAPSFLVTMRYSYQQLYSNFTNIRYALFLILYIFSSGTPCSWNVVHDAAIDLAAHATAVRQLHLVQYVVDHCIVRCKVYYLVDDVHLANRYQHFAVRLNRRMHVAST
jgi:hypothetical protein